MKIKEKISKFIKKNRGIPLSDKQVTDLVDRKAKVVLYEDLHNYDNILDVFGAYDAIFLMYQQTPTYGHWVALIKRENVSPPEIEFFDSYGGEIDSQLSWTSRNMRKVLSMDHPYLTELLATAPERYELVENNHKFQKNVKNNNTCGRISALRILLRKYSLEEFAEMFDPKNKTNEDVMTAITMLKLDKLDEE